MKWTRPAFAGTLVAGLVAFPLTAGPDELPRATSGQTETVDEPLRAASEGERVVAVDERGTPPERSSTDERNSTLADAAPAPGDRSEGTVGAARSGEHAEAEDEDRRDRRVAAEVAAAGSSRSSSPQADSGPRQRSDRRDFRRRSRNRYPGPIPSPDDWEPPEGPVKIALQAGHWRADEAPRELSGLRGGGTRWADLHEWEVNLEIARHAGARLEEMGYEVDILPAVVPPSYRAHLFISIHADGSNDARATGYRIAAPRRDATGRAEQMVALLEESYGRATGLPRIPTVTRRMRSYYAFNFRRYEHALHPMTIGVIIETGFLTSSGDRGVIVDAPERAALGIVDAVAAFPHTPPPTVVDRP